VGEAIPVDIAQVPIGAALHKAHRHHIQLLDLATGLLPGVLLIHQAVLMDQWAAAEALACFVVVGGFPGLRHEPQGELGGANPAAASELLGVVVVFAGRALELEGAHVEQIAQLGDQPAFIDEATVVVAAVMPEVETAHHHGAIREIDHGAGPIGGDQLAVADFADGMVARASRCSHDVNLGWCSGSGL